MTTSQIIALGKETAIRRAEQDNRLDIWPFYSSTHNFKYSLTKGYDYSKIVQTAKCIFSIGDFAYFAEKKGGNYYIRVMDLQTVKVDLIHYSDTLKQAKDILSIIKSDKDCSNPGLIKSRYYNGSGSPVLHWSI
jgi:hypothetical protein